MEETAEQERIRREVLTRHGRPPRLHHVAVIPVELCCYRVNMVCSRGGKELSALDALHRLEIVSSWFVRVRSIGIEFSPPLPEKRKS
jgi:hypothetical protein